MRGRRRRRLRGPDGGLPCPTMPARPTLAALAAALAVAVLAPGAHAAIPYAPCEPAGFQCGQLAVALDRTGAVPGTVTLKVKRVVASSNPTATAVVALAGGPGQAALPVATEFASILGPSLATRDLLVFDQRGTGSSGRLSCPAFDRLVTSIVDAAASAPTSSGRRAASTAPRTRSTTSRRCASSRATRSSSSSASPTAPRSRSTMPPDTRPTSSRSCWTRSSRRRAPTS